MVEHCAWGTCNSETGYIVVIPIYVILTLRKVCKQRYGLKRSCGRSLSVCLVKWWLMAAVAWQHDTWCRSSDSVEPFIQCTNLKMNLPGHSLGRLHKGCECNVCFVRPEGKNNSFIYCFWANVSVLQDLEAGVCPQYYFWVGHTCYLVHIVI